MPPCHDLRFEGVFVVGDEENQLLDRSNMEMLGMSGRRVKRFAQVTASSGSITVQRAHWR